MSSHPYRAAGKRYLEAGFSPLPVAPRAKTLTKAGYTGHSGRDATIEEVSDWAATPTRYNVAIRMPANVIGIDVDAYDGKNGGHTFAQAQLDLGILPDTWRSTSRIDDPVSGIRFFRAEPPGEGQRWRGQLPGRNSHVEIIHRGLRYAVVAPSLHPEGRTYTWIDPDGAVTDDIPTIEDLPELPPEWREYLLEPEGHTHTGSDLAGEPTAQEIVKAEGLLASACREVTKKGETEGRNNVVSRMLLPLCGFVMGGCLDESDTKEALFEAATEVGGSHEYTRDEFEASWRSAWKHAVAQRPRIEPDFEALGDDPEVWPDLPVHLDDARLAPWMAHKGLQNDWCWAGPLGWLQWDGRRWEPKRDEDAREAVRLAAVALLQRAVSSNPDSTTARKFAPLLTAARIGSVLTLMKGVVSVDAAAFDQRPELLNVGNGVVDLRTGQLLPHSRDYYLTKLTATHYVRGATHPDWQQALTCLEPDVMAWMQVRFGQAVTGHPTSDDVLPIGVGGGANGKSTILEGLAAALGEHLVAVPEKLLRVSTSDHPTELMTLFGARLAIIDETPEAAHLNVPRLKATLGGPLMTARQIRKDNVQWRPTHSLFVMTNHTPRVAETDHGTWRRLALVRFDKTFPLSNLKARIKLGNGGRNEAVLAWVIEGARRWYENDQMMPEMPEKVRLDTKAWRGQTDYVMAYIEDRIVFDADACVTAADLLTDVNEWLLDHNHKTWSDSLVAARFGEHQLFRDHEVTKSNPRNPKGLVPLAGNSGSYRGSRPKVWLGIRWRTRQDD